MSHRIKHALHRRLHPRRYSLLDELRRNETLSGAELLAKRQRDFNAVVEHAIRHSPFYRDKYRGVLPDASGNYAIADLPILKKSEVIANRDAMVDETFDRGRLKLAHTSGSTGTPLSYYWDDAKHELMRAGMCRSYMWSGWRPGERILNFWGARQDIKPPRLAKRVEAYIAAERTIAAGDASEARLLEWVRRVRRYRPVLLQGYASILAELARFVVDNRLRMPRTLVGVYATAEVLHDWQRAVMEQAFGCKVFNQYGCREVPNIAVECRQGNQHVFTDMVWLESIDEGGEARLLVTSLTNRAMPFIRYELGDVGRLKEGDCPCGSPFPLMEMDQCRSNDHVRTRSGRRLHPTLFHHLLDGLDRVRQYQFMQRDFDALTLNVVADPPLPLETCEQLRQRIRREVDPAMELVIQHVAPIPRTSSGKHRFVICEIP